MKWKWKKTDKHVCGTIYREHCEDFSVFESCTCPEGNPQLGVMNPYILTSWGFKGSDAPLIKCEQRKDSRHQETWDNEYFIAIPYEDED